MSPAINTFAQTGTPVTFSGNSGAPVTFAVASSAALLSSPDLGSGPGTLQPGTSSYTFTSTTATATSGVLVYWDASFSNATIAGCEGMTPKTYTTQVRTFTVVSPSPSPTETEAAAKKKQEEEASAKKKREEEAAVGTSSVSLADAVITVQGNGVSLVKLDCLGSASCVGQLTLSVKVASKAKGRKMSARAVKIGTVSFSITGDEAKTVKVMLTAAGRALLTADHGRLNASLMVLEPSPAPPQRQTEKVQLVQQKPHGKAKK
jgi:hypothetical protein